MRRLCLNRALDLEAKAARIVRPSPSSRLAASIPGSAQLRLVAPIPSASTDASLTAHRVLSGGADGSLVLWDLEAKKPVSTKTWNAVRECLAGVHVILAALPPPLDSDGSQAFRVRAVCRIGG